MYVYIFVTLKGTDIFLYINYIFLILFDWGHSQKEICQLAFNPPPKELIRYQLLPSYLCGKHATVFKWLM